MNNNQLTSIPSEIWNLTNLQQLYLNNNSWLWTIANNYSVWSNSNEVNWDLYVWTSNWKLVIKNIVWKIEDANLANALKWWAAKSSTWSTINFKIITYNWDKYLVDNWKVWNVKKLELNNKWIANIEWLEVFTWVEEVDLANNNIQNLPEEVVNA